MGAKTKIEWADSSVNPIMGCTCCDLYPEHCYAATLCNRYAGRKGWPTSFDQPEFFPGRMEKALEWSDLTGQARPDKPWLNGYPRVIFVNDLSDGFCPDADPWQWLNPYVAAMDLSPHIWLLLTKWPKQMRKFFEERVSPIPDNFWLGTSVCRQRDEWRIEELLRIRGATTHFVSCEPLLGPMDLSQWLRPCRNLDPLFAPFALLNCESLNGVIVGGESGPNARPLHPDWARDIRDQCQEAGVPFFFKQWGAHAPWGIGCCDYMQLFSCDEMERRHRSEVRQPYVMFHIGKHRAGRLLDGREWNEMPKAPLSQGVDRSTTP